MLDAAQRVLRDAAPQPLSRGGGSAHARALRLGAGRRPLRRRARRCCSTTSSAKAAPACACYRMFRPRRRRAPLLVDLGWLPLAGDRAPAGASRCRQARIELRGLLAPPPSTGLRAGPALRRRREATLAADARRPRRASPAHRLSAPLAPRVLRLDPDAAARLRARPRHCCPTRCRPNATAATRCNGSRSRWRCWSPRSS